MLTTTERSPTSSTRYRRTTSDSWAEHGAEERRSYCVSMHQSQESNHRTLQEAEA